MDTISVLEQKVELLIKRQQELLDMFEQVLLKVGNKFESVDTYFGQVDKNIMIHDDILNKLCQSVGMTYENNKGKFN